jgi:hypothetical protein
LYRQKYHLHEDLHAESFYHPYHRTGYHPLPDHDCHHTHRRDRLHERIIPVAHRHAKKKSKAAKAQAKLDREFARQAEIRRLEEEKKRLAILAVCEAACAIANAAASAAKTKVFMLF